MEAGRDEMRELQRMADRVCVLILSSDLPEIDIEIERGKLRERCLELFPDREWLYDMIYESRFDRLADQIIRIQCRLEGIEMIEVDDYGFPTTNPTE